jgi:molybdopterin-guanine dinucleotide biosynthesis protein A
VAAGAREPNSSAFDAIVLAGGEGRRMGPGGADKAILDVGGSRLLDRVVAAVQGARTIVVVGPRRPTSAQVVFTREEPAGSGPAAAVVHGVGIVASPVVVVVAVDVPFAASAVPRLLAALPGHDAAMLVDESGRRQPVIAAYLTASLRRRAAAGPWADRSIRDLIDGLLVAEVEAAGDEALDCDTPDDVQRARTAAAAAASPAAAAPAPSRRTPRSTPGG